MAGIEADPEAAGGIALRRKTTKAVPNVQLVLEDLPKGVAAALAAFDLDGDGTINLSELQSGADAGTRAVSKHHFYKRGFKEEVVFFNPSFTFLNSMPAWDHTNVGPVGREVPGFVDATQPFIDAAIEAMRYVYKKLGVADINWAAVAALTNDFRNIASQFFEQNAANLGQNTNVALSRIFRPSRTFEYGCYTSYWTGGGCLQRAPRFKLFGRQRGGQCILYDPYQLHCGSTVRCVANCR